MADRKYGQFDFVKLEKERREAVDRIVASPAHRKVVVAGPGTGKTFLFQTLLARHSGNCLALTFIRNLRAQLDDSLGALATCYTLHGYCKMLLKAHGTSGLTKDFRVYPNLEGIVADDAAILGHGRETFRKRFEVLEEGPLLEFFLQRGNYYDAIGFDDCVYRAITSIRRGDWALPSYAQVVVDEYQDFNALEASFIDLLALSSPILIAGDDDQAIYQGKNASPDFIRQKTKDADYAVFTLPFCSRCTQAIIRAVDDVLKRAAVNAMLPGRIPKRFECYWPEKLKESEEFPRIVHVTCSVMTRAANYPARFIEAELRKHKQVAPKKFSENEPEILVVGPTQYIRIVHEYLSSKFEGVVLLKSTKPEPNLLEGYAILLDDPDSNLGWRIVLNNAPSAQRSSAIMQTADGSQRLADVLSEDLKRKHLALVGVLERFRGGTPPTGTEKAQLAAAGTIPLGAVDSMLTQALNPEEPPAQKPGWLSLTTFHGCKGLAAKFVFVVGMNARVFPALPGQPSDLEISQFVVALTRTRRKCYLISNKRFGANWEAGPSEFIQWIETSLVDSVEVDKSYFE